MSNRNKKLKVKVSKIVDPTSKVVHQFEEMGLKSFSSSDWFVLNLVEAKTSLKPKCKSEIHIQSAITDNVLLIDLTKFDYPTQLAIRRGFKLEKVALDKIDDGVMLQLFSP